MPRNKDTKECTVIWDSGLSSVYLRFELILENLHRLRAHLHHLRVRVFEVALVAADLHPGEAGKSRARQPGDTDSRLRTRGLDFNSCRIQLDWKRCARLKRQNVVDVRLRSYMLGWFEGTYNSTIAGICTWSKVLGSYANNPVPKQGRGASTFNNLVGRDLCEHVTWASE